MAISKQLLVDLLIKRHAPRKVNYHLHSLLRRVTQVRRLGKWNGDGRCAFHPGVRKCMRRAKVDETLSQILYWLCDHAQV